MGGWLLLAAFLVLGLLRAAPPLLRGGILLVPNTRLASAHLLLAACILLDAAVFPSRMEELPVPLALSLLLAILSRTFRDTWLLLGPGGDRAPRVLEELCARRGTRTERREGSLVLKRLGTAVRCVRALPGLHFALLDRRRREPEVDRIGREWGRALSGSGVKP